MKLILLLGRRMAEVAPNDGPPPTGTALGLHGDLHIGSYTVSTEFLRKPIGHGKYGTVFRAMKSGRYFAAKRFDRKGEDERYLHDLKALYQEPPDHSNIIKMFERHWDDNRDLWLIMELCEYGNLNQYFTRFKYDFANFDLKLDMMCQAARGIKYLHENHIIHRNLAPNNILVTKSDDPSPTPVIKITDFTLSKYLKPNGSSTMGTDVCSEKLYKAPEFYFPKAGGSVPRLKYKKSIDIYSIGLVFLAMLQPMVDNYLKPTIEGEHLDQNVAQMPIGETMYIRECREGTTAVQVVMEKPENGNAANMVRRIIRRATFVEPTYRISARGMHDELEKIKADPKGKSCENGPSSPQCIIRELSLFIIMSLLLCIWVPVEKGGGRKISVQTN